MRSLNGMWPVAVVVFMVAASQALPADLPSDRPIALKECIDYALENHSSVLSAQRNVGASRFGVIRARSGFLPRITGTSNYSGAGFSARAASSGIGSGNSTTSVRQDAIAIAETLFDGWRTPTAIRQASASERAAWADLDLTRQERVLAVTTAYFNALRTKRLADIAAQTVKEAEEHRQLVQARIDAGDAAPIDIYPVDVQLANAQLTKLKADNDARVAANSLRNAIGLTKGPVLTVVDVQEPSADVPKLEECVECALRDRPELARTAAQIDSQKAAVSLAKIQRAPVPTADLSYQRGFGDSAFDSEWAIGVRLILNVFDGGAAAADVQSAKARLDSIQLTQGQSVKDISTEVEQSYLNYVNALERLSASKTNVTLAQKNVEVAREKYQQGLGIPLEITTAEVSYADAQANNAQALYDGYIAIAQLNRAMGRRDY